MKQDLEVKADIKNSLLKRREIVFIVDHSLSGTPNRLDLRKKIASKLNEDLDKVYITKLLGLAGQNKTKGIAHVYEDPKLALKIEQAYIIKRNSEKQATENKEAQAPAEKTDEKPKKIASKEE